PAWQWAGRPIALVTGLTSTHGDGLGSKTSRGALRHFTMGVGLTFAEAGGGFRDLSRFRFVRSMPPLWLHLSVESVSASAPPRWDGSRSVLVKFMCPGITQVLGTLKGSTSRIRV